MISTKLKHRTQVSFKNWDDWQRQSVPVNFRHYRTVAKLIKEMGITEFDEFQVRNGEVRFKTAEDMAFAVLNGLNEYIENV